MNALAEIGDYAELIQALRARAVERRISLQSITLHQVAGLADRYFSKVLAPDGTPAHKKRHLGRVSLGPALAVLGVKLILVECPEALARYAHRLDYMDPRDMREKSVTISRRLLREAGRKGGLARAKKLSAQRLSSQASRAVKARWKRYRAARKAENQS